MVINQHFKKDIIFMIVEYIPQPRFLFVEWDFIYVGVEKFLLNS